jgi:hypothetical protein
MLDSHPEIADPQRAGRKVVEDPGRAREEPPRAEQRHGHEPQSTPPSPLHVPSQDIDD